MNIKRADDVNKSDFCIALKCNQKDGEEILVEIAEGTGVNLLEEDEANGYVDYIYYTVYTYKKGEFVEDDGGIVLLTEPYSKLSVEQIVEKVLDMEGIDIEDTTVICMEERSECYGTVQLA